MFTIQLIAISSNESLLGISFDQGEVELEKGEWTPFTRLRIGVIFLTLDLIWQQSKKE